MQYGLVLWHLQATNSRKLLNDSLLDEDGWQQAADWLATQGFEQLASAGLQVVAWVLPRNLGAFYDTSRVLAILKRPLVETFTDAQAAYDWLQRLPPVADADTAHSPLPQLTVAGFLTLSNAEQHRCVEQLGQPQLPRWEADYYVQPYYLPPDLQVEFYYHAHSGVLYQVQAHVRPASEEV
jgi:hypothetical protein